MFKVKGCVPAMGYSFAAGTTDGPGEFDFQQGTVTSNEFWNLVRDFLQQPEPDDIECHAPKPILLATGRVLIIYFLFKNVFTNHTLFNNKTDEVTL